jgi:hypothetical protein
VSHIDPELLALRALGEELPASDDLHLAECAICAAEVDSLREVVRLGRSLQGDDVLVAPPALVWNRIAAGTGVDPATLAAQSAAATRDEPLPPTRAPSGSPPPEGPPATARSGGRVWWALAASVAGIATGAAAVLGWQALETDEPPPVVATATLAPLADPDATGTASIVGAGGERELTVDLDSASEYDGFLEVWLLSPDASGLVSLGVLRGDTATFPVPDGLDVGEFPVVDISIEPFDGDPSHSGDSVVRGTLTDA